MSAYLELTREFNAGRLRAVICSGQAVVLHRLAFASKDGDWIMREDREALDHVLGVLARHQARYRFGAPLDVRWMAGGWSAHLEFSRNGLRLRTDFFTRPPRVTPDELARMWVEMEGRDPPFTDARMLAEMKKTDCEKDYPFIGELARLFSDPRDQLLYSRSADDLIELARQHPALVRQLGSERPLLAQVGSGRRKLAESLQHEMLDLMEANEHWLDAYRRAAEVWAERWPSVAREIDDKPLLEGHAVMVRRATDTLPTEVRA